MTTVIATAEPLSDVSRRVLRLQVMTIAWMTVEAVVSLSTAWRSHSTALLAFGGDSLIELLSAAVVFWRFRLDLKEARAARIAGVLLFALAGLVILTSVLNVIGYREAQRSLMGIGILLAAAVVMPWLANRKRQLAAITSSTALKADAVESALCGYMAWIALVGLVINAFGQVVGRYASRSCSHPTHLARRMGSRPLVKIVLRLQRLLERLECLKSKNASLKIASLPWARTDRLQQLHSLFWLLCVFSNLGNLLFAQN